MKSLHWCTVVLICATTLTPTFGSQTNERKSTGDLKQVIGDDSLQTPSAQSGRRSSDDGGSTLKWNLLQRVKRQTAMMVKVKLNTGSYIYRKTSSPKASTATPSKARIARGYTGNKRKKGYRYKKPGGYVYTTPSTTTRLPPLSVLSEVDNDSQYATPPPEDPLGVRPDRDFVTEPPSTRAPFDKNDVRDNIPGEPGKDYKVYSSIPNTNFTCEGKIPGFYADDETGCQVYHRCSDDAWYTGQYGVNMDSFLCPNGTLFNQQILSCDWWTSVDCKTSTMFFQLNEQIGQLEETNLGTVQYVQFGGVRVPPPPGHKRITPKIVPKNQRKPLPDEYRTKQSYDDHGDPISDKGGSSQGLSTNNEDPENLANKFLEDDGRGFSEFSVGGVRKDKGDTDDDKEGSSQNLEEVSAKPPKRRKSTRKSGKKAKITTTTTTTTTTPPPEEEEADDEDESNETEEDQEDDDENESSATNKEDNPAGFIVNRYKEQTDPGSGILPKEVLEPPTFTGDPVDSETQRSEEKEDGDHSSAYIPPNPSPEGPTYIPPTTTEGTRSEGYSSYTKSDANNYLPPTQNTYLPPTNEYGPLPVPSTPTYLPPTNPPTGGYSNAPANAYGTPPPNNAYLPPQQNNAYGPSPTQNYLSPQQQNNNLGYLPPQAQNNPTQNNAYLPPQSPTPPQNNGYLPPQNNAYLPPPQQTNGYLPPPQQNNGYLPPPQQTNGYLPPPQQTNGYLPPPQQNNRYLPPPQQNNGYLPPTQPNNANTDQPNVYGQSQSNSAYGTQQSQNTYLPPHNQGSPPYIPPPQTNATSHLPPPQQSNPPPNINFPIQQNNPFSYGPNQQRPIIYLILSPDSRPGQLLEKYALSPPTPNNNYGQPNSNSNSNYNADNNYARSNIQQMAPPPHPAGSHSTIPVQVTPPQRGGSTFELVHVPLVSSSHSQSKNAR